MKYPVKVYICRTIRGGRWMSAGDIHAELAGGYGGERHFTPAAVEEHLRSLRAIGIAACRSPEGRAVYEWSLTEDGEARLESSYPEHSAE